MEDNLANEYENLVSLQEKIQTPEPRKSGLKKVDLVRALNLLLANTNVLALEVHGFHWNVKGPDFVEYHELFNQIYGYLDEAIDPTAENILKLGYDSPFHMSDFMKLSTIEELDPEDMPEAMSRATLQGINTLISNLKETFDIANAINEQGVANFLAEQIDNGQKFAWQLRAILGLQKPNGLI
jgi:starvation-inducible DNA-binding protein